jgi:sec-independent protein translocase protein TatA
MFFPSYALNIAGSEWFIIFIVIIIFIFPKKIGSISKTIGKFVGEYEKAKGKIMEQKNMFVSDASMTTTTTNNPLYKGPQIQRPISSEREKLEIIAKSLNINSENMVDDELRNLISFKLKETHNGETN